MALTITTISITTLSIASLITVLNRVIHSIMILIIPTMRILTSQHNAVSIAISIMKIGIMTLSVMTVPITTLRMTALAITMFGISTL